MFPDTAKIDKIILHPISHVPTIVNTILSPCYWREMSKVQYGENGDQLTPQVVVYFPAHTDVQITDEVTLMQKANVKINENNQIAWKIRKVYPVGDTAPSHMEVQL